MLKRLFSRRKGAEHEAQCLPPVYEHIYPPFYNVHAELDGREPELYDRNGRRIHVFFIRDKASVHASSQLGHHILWDKYNFGLKTHFYTHDCMLELMGKPVHRYGALVETRGIWPDYYTIFEKNAGLEQDFDKIFSYDESILDSVSNACFVPFCATIKLDFARISDLEASRRLMDDEAYRKKTRNVSILSSGKTMCELHMLRIKAARYLKERGLADAYGTFDGGPYVRAFDTLKDYRYSFVFENERSAYCFTEKLTNCFATQTVPIYLGATKIEKFFNPDGIIRIEPDDVNRLEEIVRRCTVQDYEERKDAVLDNYRRAHAFLNVEDFMYETYLADVFGA